MSGQLFAFKEPAGTVCYSFEAFSRGRILLKLEVLSFFPIIFNLFFRMAGFYYLLRMFSCFYSHFLNLGITSNGISQVLILIRKFFLTSALSNCSFYSSLFQLSLAIILFSIFLPYLCIVRKPAVFDFISCLSFC